jgi:DNA invertase Pin-like site-specific DNA recombinase
MPKIKTSTTPVSTVCVIYCRVSSKAQATEDKTSLDAQEQNGLRKAAELGLRVLYVVKDAESAWVLDKRSKFQQVLTDARAGRFHVLIGDYSGGP